MLTNEISLISFNSILFGRAIKKITSEVEYIKLDLKNG